MFKKKFLSVTLGLAVATALTACGEGDDAEGGADNGTDDGNGEDTAEENGDEEAADDIDELIMGFVPSQDAGEIADTAQPLADRLSEELGVDVEASVMVDYVGLIEAMRTQQVDIGFLPPFGFVQAEDRAGAEVILKAERHGETSYKAQYTVPADSHLETVEDLANEEGLTWAYADDLSTSGFLFPASQQKEFGVEDLDAHFNRVTTGGHDNALIALYDGAADFATTFDDARDNLADEFPDVYDDLRVLGYTDPIPNDTISVRSELPEQWKEDIKAAFLSFSDDEEMLEVLDEIYNWTGIAEAATEDYDIVREVFAEFEDELSE
ncbi:phosphate/phosphite/phosphonate ABC transporter substrate-binding protein [Alteribacter natronophilus]|uniref:phosphate/phosphite/phosphonate ABC transporter substrate-binding protein n=1 Tax=Alteribacter natronophilus TaxID=2583810 RepID=UPI00110F1E19|nr:phosphate/phosphite/phosphonate ABC transporter substrate-binding protein [Alteribacter natronophilus]TMW70452.1 phosphate/phosphite/phosphonate ABC transporter substrate-binding protein [Alteribacter natronophilus]